MQTGRDRIEQVLNRLWPDDFRDVASSNAVQRQVPC